jgi:nicotinate phosphoribosyltransferase
MTVSQALCTDLYELTMAQGYFVEGMHEQQASFSLYTRSLPDDWGYMVFAGLPFVADYLENLHFDVSDIAYLRSTDYFREDFLAYLSELRFTGNVRALREGELFFADTPLLELTAPLVQAQIVETFLINQIHLHSLLASKASRCVGAAEGRTILDFSLRRTHGIEAGLAASRSSYMAGFVGSSNVEAGRRFGIPVSGTMAHAFVTSFNDELDSFRSFARTFPRATHLLIDTYDTCEGARKAAIVGREMAARGERLLGVRIDSGDLALEATRVRQILNAGGCPDTRIFVSSDLDEWKIAEILATGAPIDGFGVGTRMGTSADQPTFSLTYKLVEINGRPCGKFSPSKASMPGRKDVVRSFSACSWHDHVIGQDELAPAQEGLQRPVFTNGVRVGGYPQLADARERCLHGLTLLPAAQRKLSKPLAVPVSYSAKLLAMQAQVRSATAARPPSQPE